MMREGWLCPRCKASVSPDERTCPGCSAAASVEQTQKRLAGCPYCNPALLEQILGDQSKCVQIPTNDWSVPCQH